MKDLLRYGIPGILSVCYAALLIQLLKKSSHFKINWKEQMERLLESSVEQLKGKEKWYENRKVYLSRIGINYRLGKELMPEEYLLLQLLSGGVCGLLGLLLFGFAGILGLPIGFFLPGVLFESMNERDNKRILNEVKGIYDTIQIKTQGGMFLTSAITECYRNTRNERLKKALLEMSGQIIAKNNLTETIDEFNMKFKNKYIDNLCIILKQSLDSGKTVEIMESIQDQLSDIQEAVNLQMRNRLESRVMLEMVLVFITLIFICVFISLMSISVDVSI